MKFRFLLFFSPLLLTACALFSPYGTTNIPEPAPLQKYTPTVTPTINWQKDVGRGSEGAYLRLTPAVTDQAIYTVDQRGNLVATSPSGKEVWSQHLKSGGKSGLASDGKILALVDENANLQVFDVKGGKHLWSTLLPDQALAAPTLISNLIIAKTIDGSVTALDAATGQQRWQYQHSVPMLMLRASSPVLVNGKLAYVGFADGKVVALNVATGDEIWSQQAAEPQGFAENERMVDIDANLVLKNGRLFVATYQGKVSALSPSTGQILWQEPNSVYADIAADNHALYAVNRDGTMTAYNQANGKTLWTQKAFAWRFLTGPLIDGDNLVVGDLQSYVHFVQASTGNLVGRIQIDKKPTAIIDTPQGLGKNIIVLNTEGHLVSLNP